MKPIHRVLVFLLVVLLPSLASADTLASLVTRLEGGDDFRVRVKAALALGKTRDVRARRPLESALRDQSPAVRAAAAAALRVLGDERAITALEKRKNDKSSSVRAQVRSSIVALKRKAARKNERPQVLVQLGEVTAEDSSTKMVSRFERESRRKLEGLPGVMVLSSAEDPAAVSLARKAPVVFVSARLEKVVASREGSGVVYSVRVQYVVHSMPGKAIVGLVSGEASARASAQESRDTEKVGELRREVLAAAVVSAVRRAPAALRAAAQ